MTRLRKKVERLGSTEGPEAKARFFNAQFPRAEARCYSEGRSVGFFRSL